jgi:hypothetical protein
MGELVLMILQTPLYVVAAYLAGWIVALPGMLISKGLDGAFPKWQAHVALVALGGAAMALYLARSPTV